MKMAMKGGLLFGDLIGKEMTFDNPKLEVLDENMGSLGALAQPVTKA